MKGLKLIYIVNQSSVTSSLSRDETVQESKRSSPLTNNIVRHILNNNNAVSWDKLKKKKNQKIPANTVEEIRQINAYPVEWKTSKV